MKYKEGDRILIKSLDWYNANKDEYGYIDCGSREFFTKMSDLCGKIATIKEICKTNCYRLEEYDFDWTDEMIECKVEKETKFGTASNPIEPKSNANCLTLERVDETKPEPKFKVGDILFYRGETSGYLKVEEIRVENGEIRYYETSRNVYLVENDPDVFADKVCSVETEETKSEDELLDDYEELTDRAFKGGYEKCKSDIELNGFQLPEGYQFVDENGNVINATKIVLEKLVVPKFKKGDKIKDKNNRVWYVVEVGNRHFDISRIPNPKGEGTGYFVPMEDQDYYELVPDRELPKTFEECVSVLMLEGGNRMSLEQMNTFRKLIDARNAYWTIYGIENGLGKPWEPTMETVYCISRNENVMKCSYRGGKSNVLEFPTEEMRDTFYENFKSEIESCKEFL